jgi:thiamine-phosphate pyrophosphorylase
MKNISKIQYITQSKTEETILAEVKDVLDSGVDWVQLRINDESLDYLTIAKKVKELTDLENVTLIINDNVEIAKQIDADGVHIELTDIPIQEIREFIGWHKIIGGTANTFADAKNVELFGADYIALGPYRGATTKKELSPELGINTYENIIPKSEEYGWQMLIFNIPIVAIGGIEVEDVKELKEKTGVHGVALSGLINNSENKMKLIKELKDILFSTL